MEPITQTNDKTEQLTEAFKLFNQLSEHLSQAYQGLEAQVVQLNQELVAARNQRLQTLMEKEKLATRLQQILAALPAGVIVLDVNGCVIDCNQLAVDYLAKPLLGVEWQTVMQRSLFEVPDCPHERSLADGRRVSIIYNTLAEEAGQIILLSDISELRTLQDLVAQQKQLSAMGEMVASMAHQVRTPLSTAILYASHLQNTQLSARQRQQFAGKIMERLQYLERQVNDMLVFAKQGKMTMDTFSLKHLVTQIQESLSSSQVPVVIEDNSGMEQMRGNEDALYGALMNLLNNAREACVDKGCIRLILQKTLHDDLKITVQDNGPGIAAEVQQRLFEPFFSTKVSGTGLGLAVVDSVIKAHHGQITCQSEPGEGTVFTVILPSTHSDELNLSNNNKQEAQHEAA